MSIKATSILRSALLGAAVAALAIAPAMAIDEGFAPRPDFPGAKQSVNNAKTKMHRSTSKSTSNRHAQHMRGKYHTSYYGAYSRGYGTYGYPSYFGPTTAGNAAAQDARLAQNPSRLRAIRQNYARER
jgi:hypothetical protein